MQRASSIFFLHLGNLVAIILYFDRLQRWGAAPDGVRSALTLAALVQAAYVGLATARRERKQFDVALLAMFAGGAIAAWLGIGPVVRLFREFSPAVLFTTFALTAILSLRRQREPFTMHFARRQTPGWQQRTAQFAAVNRVLTGYWAALFVLATMLCLWAPSDPRFTAVYPNLVIVVAGMILGRWLPPLYLRFRKFPPPDRVETLVMGMPFIFDARAAGAARATIQFHVTAPEPGDYHLRIADGRCASFEGVAAAPDLVIHTPADVWRRIARGELDGAQALATGAFHAEGDLEPLAKLGEWFHAPTGR